MIFQADSLNLDVLQLAQDGHPLVSVIGDVEWACRDVGLGKPEAFTSDMVIKYNKHFFLFILFKVMVNK